MSTDSTIVDSSLPVMKTILTAHDEAIVEIEGPVVLAIGAFDGIHRGHQAVIRSAMKLATEKQAKSLVYSFRPHPSAVIGLPKPMILTHAQKVERLAALGVDYFVEQCFDEAFSKIPAEAFVIFLQQKFREVVGICVGEDFRFGSQREGDASFLRQVAGKVTVQVEPFVVLEHQRISSSWIRKNLGEGHVERANRGLGYPYYIRGQIITGRGLATRLGFPTLNVQFDNNLLLKFGVYLVRYRFSGGDEAYGIANFGVRPTFFEGIGLLALEVHSLAVPFIAPTTSSIEVQFLHFIREERRFTTRALLVDQIRRDISIAKRKIRHLL